MERGKICVDDVPDNLIVDVTVIQTLSTLQIPLDRRYAHHSVVATLRPSGISLGVFAMALADLIMPDARRTGKVIAEFSQSASVPTTAKNWYPAGYCAGLTMRWMLRRVQGHTWPQDQKGKDAVAISWKAVGDYTTYLQNFNETWAILDDKAKVGLNAALGSMGMRVDDGIAPIAWSGGSGGKFFSAVADRSDGLWYLSIQSNKGGHALGLHVQGRLTPPLHLFDPNLGHFGLAGADDLERFGDALMSAYDRGMSAKFTWGKAYRIMPPQIGKAGP